MAASGRLLRGAAGREGNALQRTNTEREREEVLLRYDTDEAAAKAAIVLQRKYREAYGTMDMRQLGIDRTYVFSNSELERIS